jgi:hypothetical protein
MSTDARALWAMDRRRTRLLSPADRKRRLARARLMLMGPMAVQRRLEERLRAGLEPAECHVTDYVTQLQQPRLSRQREKELFALLIERLLKLPLSE